MSTSYNLEPPPTAKVLLLTTSGDIELEIFAKQIPLASRNFLQLCLDGYYNGTIFHRVVPGFVLQGGDPTGTGDGGEAIFPGGTFADEFHSRLKFNRRGLLGMANTGRKDDNGSQFFLTLGKTEELNGNNTMFGRVVGDTIYNVMKMGEAELVDIPGSERPLYPTKITGAEILVNPFEDMVKREPKVNSMSTAAKGDAKKKPKKKAGKAFLSFADGDGDDSTEPVFKKSKFNTNLVQEDTSSRSVLDRADPPIKKPRATRRKVSRSPSPPVVTKVEPQTQLPLPDEEASSRGSSVSPEPAQVSRVSSMLEKTNAQIAELKASMKRTTASAPSETQHKKSALEEMIPEHAIRGRKRKQANRDTSGSDARALDIFNAFRAKLDGASAKDPKPDTNGHAKGTDHEADPDAANQEDEEASLCDLHFIANCQSCQAWDKEDDADSDADMAGNDWMAHSLSFGKDKLGKDLSWKKKNEDDLVVIDPREKAREIKEGQKSRKTDRGSQRAWDRDRDRGKLPERPAAR